MKTRLLIVSTLLIGLTTLVLAFLAAPAWAASCQAQHTVKAGENLYRIGLKYGVDWPSIAKANNLANPNRIYPGRSLCIPAATTPTPKPSAIPTFGIIGVVRDEWVTIRTANFPAGYKFDVLMGEYGTRGIGGAYVTTIDSGQGGSFTATVPIPRDFWGYQRIAIRLQGASGYHSYNWFYNNTTQ
ncbi:MAG: LysM peptidoglycan-binding domain-containing protein [Candidatus Entotheonellia bacterium]